MTQTYDEVECHIEEKIEDFYDILQELGRGQFAVVKKCISKKDNIEVAAKYVKLKRTKSSRNGLSREAITREASILKSLDHEKVIKLYDLFDIKIEMVLVLELLSGGELFDKICELEYLTEFDACCYMKQVLEAIDHLHDNNVVHLDIKPENIVLKSKDSADIKLVDFGLAQRLYPGHDLKEMMGTPEFVAPEIINYETIGLYTDMWAIGVLAYILLSGCSPFLGDDNQETYENIIKADYHFDDEYFDTISDEAKQFVTDLLIKTPKKRNTVKVCLDSPWIHLFSTKRSRNDSTVIATGRFKAFVARRRWQQSFQKLNAITRFSKFLKKGATLTAFTEENPGSRSPSPSPISSPEPIDAYDEQLTKNNSEEEQKEINIKEIELETKNVVNESKKETDLNKSIHNNLENQNTHQSPTVVINSNTETILSSNSLNTSTTEQATYKTLDQNNSLVTDTDNITNITISINEIQDDEVQAIEKVRSNSTLDSPKPKVRKESLASKLNPSQRRYSREDPVRYTEQIKEMMKLEAQKVPIIAEESDESINTTIKLSGIQVGLENDNSITTKTNEGDIIVNGDADEINFEENIDLTNIKEYDIRETTDVRTSIRKKAVMLDHKDVQRDEPISKSDRSLSLSETRKAFILGSRSNTSDGLVDLAKRRSLKSDSNLKLLREAKDIEKKDDIITEVSEDKPNDDKTDSEIKENSQIIDNNNKVTTEMVEIEPEATLQTTPEPITVKIEAKETEKLDENKNAEELVNGKAEIIEMKKIDNENASKTKKEPKEKTNGCNCIIV